MSAPFVMPRTSAAKSQGSAVAFKADTVSYYDVLAHDQLR